jgi:hypothetical protein
MKTFVADTENKIVEDNIALYSQSLFIDWALPASLSVCLSVRPIDRFDWLSGSYAKSLVIGSNLASGFTYYFLQHPGNSTD